MTDDLDEDAQLDAICELLRQPGVTLGPVRFTHGVDENGNPTLRWSQVVEGVKFAPRYEAKLSSE